MEYNGAPSVSAGFQTYIWGLRYIDDLICRETDSEKLYSLADPNWNSVATANETGTITERLTYNAFGAVTFRTADFTARAESLYNWNRTFTGQVLDTETGLMLYRNRYYHCGLGRFVTRDPIGYEAQDVSLYRYVWNGTTNRLDPYGEDMLDCIADCVDANDPTNYLLKAAILAGGANSKLVAAWIFRLAGNNALADMVIATSGKGANKIITNNWSIIAGLLSKDKTLAKQILRKIGNVGVGLQLAYGLLLAYVEAYCAAFCGALAACGSEVQYDNDAGAMDKTTFEYWFN